MCRWYWDIVVTALLIFTVTILPVSIAFYSEKQLNPEWLTINILVDFLFLADVFVNFRTGVHSQDDEVVKYIVYSDYTIIKQHVCHNHRLFWIQKSWLAST